MSRPNAYSISLNMNTFKSRTAQLGLRYLHSGGSPVQNGVKVAIACLYSPLGAAVDGQSLQQVRLKVGASRGSFEAYMVLATSRTKDSLAGSTQKQRVDPKENTIKTTSVENKDAGLGAKYLNSGVIELSAGVELAIACLYGPLGTAIGGGMSSEIAEAIFESRRTFDKYMDLALRQFADDNNLFVRFPDQFSKTTEDTNTQTAQRVISGKKPAVNLLQRPADLNGEAEDEIDLNEEL